MAAPSTSRSSPMAMAPSAAPMCPPSPLNTPSSSPGEASMCPRAPSGYVLCIMPCAHCQGPQRKAPDGAPCGRCWLSLVFITALRRKGPTKRLTGPAKAGVVVLGKGLEGGPLCQASISLQVNVGEGSHPERVKVYGPGVEKTGLKANEPTYFTVDCSEAGQGAPSRVGLEWVWAGGLILWSQLVSGHSSSGTWLVEDFLEAPFIVLCLPPFRRREHWHQMCPWCGGPRRG